MNPLLPVDQGTYCLNKLAEMATKDAPFSIKGLSDGYFEVRVGEVSWVLTTLTPETLMGATIGIMAAIMKKNERV